MDAPEEEIYQYDQKDKAPEGADLSVGYRQGENLPGNGSGVGSGAEVDPAQSYAVSPADAGDPSAIQNPGSDWSILGAARTDPMGVPLPQYVDPTRTLGPFDAYCAVVVQVFSPSRVHPVTNCANTIEVRRCSVSWDSKYNYPKAGARSMASAGPTPTLASPFPFPLRHDQAGYVVKAGDVVSVIQGRDGRAWYMVDDLPFVGTVWGQITKGYESLSKFPTKDNADLTKRAMVDDIALAADSAKYYRFDGVKWVETPQLVASGATGKAPETGEWHAGNAGYQCVDVRRRILGPTSDSRTADPDSSAFDGAVSRLLGASVGKDDLKAPGDVYVTYRHVWVVADPTVHHGYRVGDPILVHPRGRYYLAGPSRQQFFAKITNAGPAGEPDFDASGDLAKSNHYWVKEQARTVTYNVSNAWTHTSMDDYQIQTPAQMANQLFCHWVDAINLDEAPGSHALPVDGSMFVVVHVFASPTTGQPHYCFSRALVGEAAPVHNLLNGDTHPDTILDAVAADAMITGNATPKWKKITSPGTSVGAAGLVTYNPALAAGSRMATLIVDGATTDANHTVVETSFVGGLFRMEVAKQAIPDGAFWAQITGMNPATGYNTHAYTWNEIAVTVSGNDIQWATGGRTSANTGQYAYEANHFALGFSSNSSIGDVVLLVPTVYQGTTHYIIWHSETQSFNRCNVAAACPEPGAALRTSSWDKFLGFKADSGTAATLVDNNGRLFDGVRFYVQTNQDGCMIPYYRALTFDAQGHLLSVGAEEIYPVTP